MKILIIDGQGGGMGRSIVEKLCKRLPDAELIAVGSNALATSNMLRAGVTTGASGENAVAVCCKMSDIIVGPIGIVLANSMYGEITRDMAAAVAESGAYKVLIPVRKSGVDIAGISSATVEELINDAIERVCEAAERIGTK